MCCVHWLFVFVLDTKSAFGVCLDSVTNRDMCRARVSSKRTGQSSIGPASALLSSVSVWRSNNSKHFPIYYNLGASTVWGSFIGWARMGNSGNALNSLVENYDHPLVNYEVTHDLIVEEKRLVPELIVKSLCNRYRRQLFSAPRSCSI